MIENLVMKGMNKLPPETAHNLAVWAMHKRFFAQGEYATSKSYRILFGIPLPNPFGIAAGFDKRALLMDAVKDYGFGFIEEGSFTLRGGEGDKKPRLFRLPDGSLLNRMGLNCISSYEAYDKLRNAKNKYSFAVSIAKSNHRDILGEKAIEDIVRSYNLLSSLGIYIAIDISCPSTKDRTIFQQPEVFRELVSKLRSQEKRRPVVFKFSPNLTLEHLEKLVEISHDFADGYGAVNTKRIEHEIYGVGGLSGPALRESALQTIHTLRNLTKKPIIGVGGISTGTDSRAMEKVGANVFLVYTGFVYKNENNPLAGPSFAYKINEQHFYKM